MLEKAIFQSNKECCAFAYQRQKVPRDLFRRIEESNLSSIHGCGLYDYLCILSCSTSFKNEAGYNARIALNVIRGLMGYRTKKMAVLALERLQCMGLIQYKLFNENRTVLINVLEWNKDLSVHQVIAERSAVNYQNGFFFVSKFITSKFMVGNFTMSERDIYSDIILNTVVNDYSIPFSTDKPIFTLFTEDLGINVKQTNAALATRWHSSVGRVNQILNKLKKQDFISINAICKLGTFIFVPLFSTILFFRKCKDILLNSIKEYAKNINIFSKPKLFYGVEQRLVS